MRAWKPPISAGTIIERRRLRENCVCNLWLLWNLAEC